MKSHLQCFALAITTFVVVIQSSAQAQTLPAQLKGAVRQAIEHGEARVVASPAMAEPINRSIGRPANAPIRIALSRLQAFGSECARLNLQFSDAASPLFAMQMNLCKDGSAPLDAVDLADPVTPPQSTAVPRLKPLQQK